jgi:hypothetical protein
MPWQMMRWSIIEKVGHVSIAVTFASQFRSGLLLSFQKIPNDDNFRLAGKLPIEDGLPPHVSWGTPRDAD